MLYISCSGAVGRKGLSSEAGSMLFFLYSRRKGDEKGMLRSCPLWWLRRRMTKLWSMGGCG